MLCFCKCGVKFVKILTKISLKYNVYLIKILKMNKNIIFYLKNLRE